jgi:hypothetical protein
MNGLIQSILLGFARTAVAAGAGWLASKGFLSGDQVQGFEGSALFLIPVALSAVDKFVVKGKIAQAATNPQSDVAVAAKA